MSLILPKIFIKSFSLSKNQVSKIFSAHNPSCFCMLASTASIEMSSEREIIHITCVKRIRFIMVVDHVFNVKKQYRWYRSGLIVTRGKYKLRRHIKRWWLTERSTYYITAGLLTKIDYIYIYIYIYIYSWFFQTAKNLKCNNQFCQNIKTSSPEGLRWKNRGIAQNVGWKNYLQIKQYICWSESNTYLPVYLYKCGISPFLLIHQLNWL